MKGTPFLEMQHPKKSRTLNHPKPKPRKTKTCVNPVFLSSRNPRSAHAFTTLAPTKTIRLCCVMNKFLSYKVSGLGFIPQLQQNLEALSRRISLLRDLNVQRMPTLRRPKPKAGVAPGGAGSLRSDHCCLQK